MDGIAHEDVDLKFARHFCLFCVLFGNAVKCSVKKGRRQKLVEEMARVSAAVGDLSGQTQSIQISWGFRAKLAGSFDSNFSSCFGFPVIPH